MLSTNSPTPSSSSPAPSLSLPELSFSSSVPFASSFVASFGPLLFRRDISEGRSSEGKTPALAEDAPDASVPAPEARVPAPLLRSGGILVEHGTLCASAAAPSFTFCAPCEILLLHRKRPDRRPPGSCCPALRGSPRPSQSPQHFPVRLDASLELDRTGICFRDSPASRSAPSSSWCDAVLSNGHSGRKPVQNIRKCRMVIASFIERSIEFVHASIDTFDSAPEIGSASFFISLVQLVFLLLRTSASSSPSLTLPGAVLE